jgi:hypothetical protein
MGRTGRERTPGGGEEGKKRLRDSINEAKNDPEMICHLVNESVCVENRPRHPASY